MKKFICFIMIFAAAIATMFALASCGKKDDDITDIPAEIPYVSDFACDYYAGEGFADLTERSTAFGCEDEVLIKLSFTLSNKAFKDGKRKLIIKPILPDGVVGSIFSANTSSVNDKELTAAYDVDDRKSKDCEIELKAKFNYSGGNLQIGYAYDEDEFQATGSYLLLCGQSFQFTYDAKTDGYIVSRDPDNSKWFLNGDQIKIPDMFAGKPVTVLGDSLFYGCNLTSVLIPDTITSIGGYTFECCSNLKNFVIPDSVTSIGKFAFCGCSSLTSITIPDSVIQIGDYAFDRCSNLTSVTIPNGVTSIGEGTFMACSNLTSITIPDNVIQIGNYAFGDCCSLTNVTIPNGVTSIGDGTFKGCSNLTSITIPNSVTSIGFLVFDGCSSLTSITIPNGVTSIGYRAFEDCSNLTSITIPNSITSIGKWTFGGCNSLEYNKYGNALYLGNENNPYLVLVKAASADVTNVDINEFTKIIYVGAFAKCFNLTSITIPDSITEIGEDVFSDCRNLQYNQYDNAYYLGNKTNPYAVLIKRVSTYVREVKINDTTKYIGPYAFKDCKLLESVTISSSVSIIGAYAFSGCDNLTSVVIPDSVTAIGSYAFSGCSSLKNVSFDGTIAEWKSISRSAGKASDTGNVTVKCSDGELKFDFSNEG